MTTASAYARYKSRGVCPTHTNRKVVSGQIKCQECLEYHRKYYGLATEDVKQRKRDKEAIRMQTPRGKWTLYKRNAKAVGRILGLTFDEFMLFWQKPCVYCGNKISTIGLDRIDNNIGYTVSNTVSCCEWCNKMKWVYSQIEFIKQCEKIVENYGNK
jgi:uncharacterized protein with PIN domain